MSIKTLYIIYTRYYIQDIYDNRNNELLFKKSYFSFKF